MPRAVAALAVLTLALAALSYGAGELLSAPATRTIGAPPRGLPAEAISLDGFPGEPISGWFVRGTPGLGAVLLLHGVRGDRRQMIERSKFLHAAGYSTLLVDLPAHGESAGTRITFGHREAEGVRAAMRFLRQSVPRERIGVIGVSMGAASLVLARVSHPPNAVVLESMYPTIEEAVTNRLHTPLGILGAKLVPVLLWQMSIRLGLSADQLRPIDHLASLHAPVLIASGTEDRHTTVAETRRLFAAAVEPKELWLVEGAAHVDLHAFSPQAYESRVSAFLRKHLRNPGS